LDIEIVAVCLHAAFCLLFAFEIIDVDEEVFAVQIDFAGRQLFQVVLVVKFHELLEAGYTIEVPVGVLQFIQYHSKKFFCSTKSPQNYKNSCICANFLVLLCPILLNGDLFPRIFPVLPAQPEGGVSGHADPVRGGNGRFG
jgi:hypothetical protein